MTVTLPGWLEPVRRVAAKVSPRDLSPLVPAPPSDARPAAVLMLFGDGPQGPDLLLTQRASTLRAHAGQISFPGGSVDPDDDGPRAAALREAHEEVGLPPQTVEVFGTLPELWLPPSNFAVTPVLGYWRDAVDVRPVDTAEVAAVFRRSIEDLMEPRNRFTTVHPLGWRGPAFDIGLETPLWGFTAGIIARLAQAVGWERPWNVDDLRPVPAAR